jgi:putative hydrolase of HD superfamily
MSTPEQVVQAQLNAYNAKDIDALMSTYHPEAEQYLLHGERLAQSHGQIRPRFMARFTEPDLHAQLLQRTVMGYFVVDAERVTRNFPDRIGHVDMLCIYEVRDGLIVKAGFGMGEPVLAL